MRSPRPPLRAWKSTSNWSASATVSAPRRCTASASIAVTAVAGPAGSAYLAVVGAPAAEVLLVAAVFMVVGRTRPRLAAGVLGWLALRLFRPVGVSLPDEELAGLDLSSWRCA